jgi:hypothetical protein
MHGSDFDNDRRVIRMSNNCFNWNPQPLDKPIRAIAKTADLYIMRTNNTPQAYLPVHQHDAQTGGLLISGGGNEI